MYYVNLVLRFRQVVELAITSVDARYSIELRGGFLQVRRPEFSLSSSEGMMRGEWFGGGGGGC